MYVWISFHISLHEVVGERCYVHHVTSVRQRKKSESS